MDLYGSQLIQEREAVVILMPQLRDILAVNGPKRTKAALADRLFP